MTSRTGGSRRPLRAELLSLIAAGVLMALGIALFIYSSSTYTTPDNRAADVSDAVGKSLMFIIQMGAIAVVGAWHLQRRSKFARRVMIALVAVYSLFTLVMMGAGFGFFFLPSACAAVLAAVKSRPRPAPIELVGATES